MHKDFDSWNTNKKDIDDYHPIVFPRQKEIWRCVLGLNIGAEVNGKSPLYERPVLILKVYNADTILVAPLTSKTKNDKFHYKIELHGIKSWVKLTQIRVISCKRLIALAGIISDDSFSAIKVKLFHLI